MKPVGILGGTFDPVHIGHLITAQFLVELRQLEKIIFIPCNISPHKTESNHSLPFHRVNMLKLAIAGNNSFEISTIEIERSGISYTYDTVLELKKKYNKIELIIGFDNLAKFDTWKEPDKLIQLTSLVVMRRKARDEQNSQDKYSKAAFYVDTPHIEVSSTIIRERVKNNLPVDFLVTPEVKDYIYRNKLYVRENID